MTYHVIPPSRLTQAHLNKRMVHQGISEACTWYRRQTPGRSRLALGIAEQLFGLSLAVLRCAVRLAIGQDSWHMDCAKSCYHSSRMKTCWRLMHDDRRRQLLLKDDWLEE